MKGPKHLARYVASEESIKPELVIYLLQMKLLESLFSKMSRNILLLKGGMAMRILTNSSRHTKDIDMAGDPEVPMTTIKSHMKAAINKAIQSGLIEKGTFREQDLMNGGLSPKWHINGKLPNSNVDIHLTIEVSRRDKLPDEAITTVEYTPDVNTGIAKFTARTYTPAAVAASKIAALLDPKRNAARDIYDLYILVQADVEMPIEMLAGLGKDDIELKIKNLQDKLDFLNYDTFRSQVMNTLPEEMKVDEDAWDIMRYEVGIFVRESLDRALMIAGDPIPRKELKNYYHELIERRKKLESENSAPQSKAELDQKNKTGKMKF